MLDRENLYNDPYDECGSFRLDRKDSGNPASDWYLGRFQDFLQECTDILLHNIGGEDVRSIILGGSFALDEGSILLQEGNPLFLSDIDLLVVMESVKPLLEVLEMKERLGRECERSMPEARFIGRVDVGAVHVDELSSFSHSPGVFVMREHGRVLYGDGSILDLLPSFGAEDIPGLESLTLLENRMASFLGHYPSQEPETEEQLLGFLYEICRSYTDLLTAVTVLTSSFKAGYQERWRTVGNLYSDGYLSMYMDEPLLLRTGKWSVFKICPSLDILETTNLPVPSIWRETAADLQAVWAGCAKEIYGRELQADTVSDIGKIARVRGDKGSILSKLRSWRRLLKGMSGGEALKATLFAGRFMLKTTPEGLLRAASAYLVDVAADTGPGTVLDRDPRGFPFNGSDWGHAAESCNRWWSRLVFGRDRS